MYVLGFVRKPFVIRKKPFVVRLLTDTKAFFLVVRGNKENAHPSADGTYVSGFKKLILVGTRDFHIAKYHALRNDV